MLKRNLDSIYIRVKNESVCLSDCTKEQRYNWLEGLDRERLINVAEILAETIRKIGDELDIVREE